jgi:hypothetical protein
VENSCEFGIEPSSSIKCWKTIVTNCHMVCEKYELGPHNEKHMEEKCCEE